MASQKEILSNTALEKPSAKGFIVGVAVATLVAIGSGAAIGLQFSSLVTPVAKSNKSKKEKPEPIAKNYIGNRTVKALPPIITNLSEPKNAWIRMEASIILDGKEVAGDVIAAEIAQDTLAYLRTLTLLDIEGASGLAYLRGDLRERAIVRSSGKVLEFVIGSMVVE